MRNPSFPRRCQSTNLRTSTGRSSSSGNASGVWRRTARSASRKTRCQVSWALWGLAGERDRLLQVLVVQAQELQRRAPLDQQVLSGHRAGARAPADRDLALLPELAPGAGVDPAPDRLERCARGERLALVRGQHGRVDALDDPERGQQLEVEADAHEPSGVGEVAPLVDDVPDQRARVQLGLVGADQQHRMPRVVGVREARDLALGVGDHDLRDDPLVQRAHLRDVVDLERDGGLGDGRAVAHEAHADVQVLREERRERVLAGEITQREQVRAVLVERGLAQLPVGVEDRGRGRAPRCR